MSTLPPPLGPQLNHRTASPAISISNRPVYLDLQDGEYSSPPSGATTPHGHPLPSYFRPGPSKKEITPVPYAKLLPLCIARSAEGMIGSIIMPYVNEMILSFGVNENDVGIWSAIAESSFMATEAVIAPFYAPIGDKYGRRPVVLVLIAFWGIFAMGFGLSGSVITAVVMRGCLGLLAGVGVLTRTMVGEMCDKTNRVQGFAVFTPALTVGFTLGPLFGGILANPVPKLLPPSFTLLSTYPYLLPALFSGAWALSASATGYFLLPETLPPKLKSRPGEIDKRNNTAGNLLRYTPFRNMVVLYGMVNGIQFAWEAFFPLFAFTSTELGGLGLGVDAIGIVMASSAGLSIMMTVFVFPYLHNRLPENFFLRLCLFAYPVGVLFFPFAWYFNYTSTVSLPKSVCVLLAMQMICRRMGDFSATLLDTFVLDVIPNPEYLALANSLAFSIAAVGRAVGPFMVSYFFSISTHAASPYSIARHIVWVLFIGMCIPSLVLAAKLDKDKPDIKDDSEEEERHELLSH